MTTNEKSAQAAVSESKTQIICDVCGKQIPPFRLAHDCDGGEALRKAAHELFAPVIPLIQKVIEKSGTGILRGVFEVVYERDALQSEVSTLRAELDAAQAECARLRGALALSLDLPELNPSNYSHDDVCELNAKVIELVLAARAAIAKATGAA